MNDILKLARIQIGIIVVFAFFKFIRPSVLESNAPSIFKTILLSLPNFFEALVGICTLTAIGLYINSKMLPLERQLKHHLIYIIAVIITAIYVLTQEFKIHNLGGNNVFDINDVLFSGIGLLVGYIIILWIQPKANRS